MSEFGSLRQDYFHRISVGPFEPRVTETRLSDIVLHLPVLEYFASLCDHVTEFGVREAHSTVAFLSGCKGHVHSCDIERSPMVVYLIDIELPCQWTFTEMDTGSEEQAHAVGETDLLFIDTLHTYEHVKKELALHGRKARKYLAFHDTFVCGELDITGSDPRAAGILPAIQEFLDQYPGEYKIAYRSDWSNGLLILERDSSYPG